jgi:chaperonin GroES
MNIRPLHDRVVIKRIDDEETKIGGLFIPDSAKEKPQQGEVMAIGKGKHVDGKLIPLDVQVGDRVLFGKYSGSDVPKAYGEEYMIMREDEILGVLEGAGKKAKA